MSKRGSGPIDTVVWEAVDEMQNKTGLEGGDEAEAARLNEAVVGPTDAL